MQYPIRRDTIQEARKHQQILATMNNLFALLDDCSDQQFSDMIYSSMQQRTRQLDMQEELEKRIQEYELNVLEEYLNRL